jgi:ABC-type multidrug transport system ATPase subunit
LAVCIKFFQPQTANCQLKTEMYIILKNIGRRFNREWIFKGIDYVFETGKSYAILGPNGSGKSTLFQVLNGSLAPSLGDINYIIGDSAIEIEEVYKHISIAAPYLELIEEFTLAEVIDFHYQFKSYINNMSREGVIALLGMEENKNKPIKYFSSGMKQRLKLALAFCSDTPMLMLDEPTSNLDTQGVEWYLNLIHQFALNRITIICSNQAQEYSFCDEQLSISDYKTKLMKSEV